MKRAELIKQAANNAPMALVVNKTVKELYDYAEPVLDLEATIIRVKTLAKEAGLRPLNAKEVEQVSEVIEERFSSYMLRLHLC